ncbi:hypothetical protein CIK76_18815 [Glutamicibacter sp. BW80]|uniref:single-stranded DNA-binding protein n=1 Tax=Glutamicibacter sp. BW80 TaxID=2024404 RepID=UPI000BB92E0E|nr:single-stranded DNA-binding protein [Glutamicibacter sp. BW80]PCC27047.1 hypothetical protein CIK76_18815 [Glutamicibacter sp. BW80]
MSHIIRSGNLVRIPELRKGDKGSYAYARVAVTDAIRAKDGSFTDGPAIFYDVQVSGVQAEELVETATESGNVRVIFSGRYRVTEYKGAQGSTIQHQVTADEIGISLRNQSVRAAKRKAQPVSVVSAQGGPSQSQPQDTRTYGENLQERQPGNQDFFTPPQQNGGVQNPYLNNPGN